MTRKAQAGVFLVRVWHEDGQFRAHLSYSGDLLSTTPHETQITTAVPAELEGRFATWLQAVLDRPDIGPDPAHGRTPGTSPWREP